jgi:Eco29kI restriction endonuclease
MSDTPYNPLDKRNLGESVAAALLRRPVGSLPPLDRFVGAGVYAIYYVGRFDAYRPIAEANRDQRWTRPIYVGKAVPPGARKGGFGLSASAGPALFKRLREHANSIGEAQNIDIHDFSCRYLISDDIWIPLGESLLIEQFKPLWNVLVEGFGIHKPGKNRPQQTSKWDTLHPGRRLAAGLPPNPLESTALLRIVSDFFAGREVKTLTPEEAVVEEGMEDEEE